MTTTPLAARITVALISLSALTLAGSAAAEDRHLSVMLQNDVFAGHDGGGYTNGLAVSYLRSTSQDETDIAPQWLLAPVAPFFGMGPATLAATSVNQIMITPRDITRKEPNPMDAPYLGALWVRAGQVSVQGDIADTLNINLGMIGPASGARQAQTFIHRITGSSRPEGWDSQVSNRLLFGVERYRAVRFASGDGASAAPAGDAIVLGGVAAGNLLSSVGGSVLLRYGTSLQRSYASSVRMLARSGDPLIFGRGWMVYGGVHADHFFAHAGISNDLPPGGTRAELRKSQLLGLAGIAYGWGESSLSFSLQSTSALTTGIGRRQAYGSLTYTTALR
ncbi:MAG: lipid A deacylase LpxR family protein [Duganella sp.]